MRITLILLFCCHLIHAQYDHQSVFPNLNEEALQEALSDNFRPQVVLGLSQARDTLYRRVHLSNDSVRCVYSGLTRYLDLNLDPSQALFGNGNNTDINLEHSYPRSKGADEGNAVSDMHHLFPTRVPVNTARASKPFAEIVDNQTDTWYWQDRTLSSPPNTNRQLYAEDEVNGFEPREDFKGNVARAAFYFYTIYRSEAEEADPDFFESQRSTLCDWHDIDPVDSLEWVRNEIIASYQDDKLNPFILDCSLARLYCDDILPTCRTVSTANAEVSPKWRIYPNPATETILINFDSLQEGMLVMHNMHGQIIDRKSINQKVIRWSISHLPKGVYMLSLHTENRTPHMRKVVIQY